MFSFPSPAAPGATIPSTPFIAPVGDNIVALFLTYGLIEVSQNMSRSCRQLYFVESLVFVVLPIICLCLILAYCRKVMRSM